MFILDGRPLPLDTQFTVDGITYPPNWLRLASPEDRARIGITEVPDYPRPDDRSIPRPDPGWKSRLDALLLCRLVPDPVRCCEDLEKRLAEPAGFRWC